MTLCTSCNYPIPSWQHNGACKPVAEKVPEVHTFRSRWIESERTTLPSVTRVTEIRTETPEPVTNPRVGRPRVTNPSAAALRQREARERKKRGQ